MKKLIVISTPFFFPGESLVLAQLFEEGMQRLHLRKPEGKQEELCRLLDEIPVAFHPKIVLHDCFGLVAEYGLGGIHLNKRNSRIPAGFKGTISRSCHSIEELAQFRPLDYLFLSPIFQSISKEGYGNGFAMETLQQASDTGIINEKVIALGGIDLTTLPQLQPLHFGGAAVLGALWGSHPSVDQTYFIITQYKKLQTWN